MISRQAGLFRAASVVHEPDLTGDPNGSTDEKQYRTPTFLVYPTWFALADCGAGRIQGCMVGTGSPGSGAPVSPTPDSNNREYGLIYPD